MDTAELNIQEQRIGALLPTMSLRPTGRLKLMPVRKLVGSIFVC